MERRGNQGETRSENEGASHMQSTKPNKTS